MADHEGPGLSRATQHFVDEVHIWAVSPGIGAEGVVREACNVLLAGGDSEHVVELAGMSPTSDHWDVLPLAQDALEEFGYHVWAPETEAAQMAGLRAQARRVTAGELSARDFAAWAHRVIGHAGATEAQPLVEADDEYDEGDYRSVPEHELEARVLELARQLGDH